MTSDLTNTKNKYVTLDAVWRVLNSPEAAAKCLDDEQDRRAVFALIAEQKETVCDRSWHRMSLDPMAMAYRCTVCGLVVEIEGFDDQDKRKYKGDKE